MSTSGNQCADRLVLSEFESGSSESALMGSRFIKSRYEMRLGHDDDDDDADDESAKSSFLLLSPSKLNDERSSSLMQGLISDHPKNRV